MNKRIARLAFLLCLIVLIAAGVFWLFAGRVAKPARQAAPAPGNAATGPGDGSITLVRPPFLK